MRYPKFLKDSGKIGVCAPSFGTTIEPYLSRLDNAIKIFNKIGHQVILTDSVRSLHKARSTFAIDRAKEFLQVYNNKDIDIVISEAGGELMCEILEFLDFNKISIMEPKWFMGYSDNTLLTFLLPTFKSVIASRSPSKLSSKMISYTGTPSS